MNLGLPRFLFASLLLGACAPSHPSSTSAPDLAPDAAASKVERAGVGDAGRLLTPRDGGTSEPEAAPSRLDAAPELAASGGVGAPSELDAAVGSSSEPDVGNGQLTQPADEGQESPSSSPVSDDDSALPDAGSAQPDTGSTQLDTGGALLADAGPQQSPLQFTVPPSLAGNPNPAAPQAAVLSFELSRPADVSIEVVGGGETWTLVRDEAQTVWQVPIIGVRPATGYQVTVKAEDLTASAVEWTSPALPAGFPVLDLARADLPSMEPGMTLFIANRTKVGDGFIVIVDETGVVRWYYRDERRRLSDHRRLASGNFLFLEQAEAAVEIDVLGETVGRWFAAHHPRNANGAAGVAVDVPQLHHEIQFLPNGDLLALTSDTQIVENYPTTTSGASSPTESQLVAGDVIVEFTPTGEIVKRISLLDLLDPARVVSEESLVIRSSIHPEGAADWAHSNALLYEPNSDAYYVSIRHQSVVVKIDRSTEQLVWMLGTPEGWNSPWKEKLLEPVGDLTWPSHQHAVELYAGGLGLYDNGNSRSGAGGHDFSRAVRFEIDEEQRTVQQGWSYGPESGADSFYSPAMGDADWQPETGNVLMTNAILSDGADGFNYGQLLEVTPAGERVFTLNVSLPDQNVPIYRADRIADIRR